MYSDCKSMEKSEIVWLKRTQKDSDLANEYWFRPLISSEFETTFIIFESGEGVLQKNTILLEVHLFNPFLSDVIVSNSS